MRCDGPVEDHVDEEPGRDHGQHGIDGVRRRRQGDGLGDQVEEGDADHRARAEPEDQMEPILQSQRDHAAEQRHEKSRDAHRHAHQPASRTGHGPVMSDSYLNRKAAEEPNRKLTRSRLATAGPKLLAPVGRTRSGSRR